jgi:hypothetical protein
MSEKIVARGESRVSNGTCLATRRDSTYRVRGRRHCAFYSFKFAPLERVSETVDVTVPATGSWRRLARLLNVLA